MDSLIAIVMLIVYIIIIQSSAEKRVRLQLVAQRPKAWSQFSIRSLFAFGTMLAVSLGLLRFGFVSTFDPTSPTTPSIVPPIFALVFGLAFLGATIAFPIGYAVGGKYGAVLGAFMGAVLLLLAIIGGTAISVHVLNLW